jgi:hypothetical protein
MLDPSGVVNYVLITLNVLNQGVNWLATRTGRCGP